MHLGDVGKQNRDNDWFVALSTTPDEVALSIWSTSNPSMGVALVKFIIKLKQSKTWRSAPCVQPSGQRL